MKKLKITLITSVCLVLAAGVSTAQEIKFGIEGGIAAAELGAANTAQQFANLTGRTVSYTEEGAALAGRIFVEYGVSDNISAEVGYFATSNLDANYSFSGTAATAHEGASANGIDFGAKFKATDEIFFRAGIHFSDLNQNASVKIGNTTYVAAVANQSGTGTYFGGGFNVFENASVGITQYMDLGGVSGADATFLFVGYKF
ncbi:hypothetical protein N9501_09725 [Amylibacter sp.]|nr:hypothetical protein [Amylibacter sp.]